MHVLSMYMYTCTCVYTCIHVQYIHNTVCTLYIHVYLQHHTCTCAYMYTCTCTCICSTCVACVPFTCTFMYMYDDVSTNHMSCMILSCIPVWLAPLPPSLPPSLPLRLNNPILEAGFEIICSPSTAGGSLEAVKKTLQVCQVELHPFFVSGHDGKSPLNSQVHVHDSVFFLEIFFRGGGGEGANQYFEK